MRLALLSLALTAALAVTLAAPVPAGAFADGVCCGPWRNSGQIAVSPDGRNVYASDDQTTLALRRDPATGGLELIDSYTGGGSSVELSPDGRHVYVTGGFVGSYGTSQIAAFARDPASGALSHAGRFKFTSYGQVTDLEFRDERTAYVLENTRNALVTLTRDPGSGRLEFRRELRGNEVEGLNRPVGMAIAGDRVYVHQDMGPRVLSAFAIDASGELTPAPDPCGECFSHRDLEVSPDGRRLVAGPFGPYAYAIDPATGDLGDFPVESTTGSGGDEPGDGGIAFSPDGADVYAADWWGSSVYQMANEAGGMRLERRYVEGRDGDGIAKPRAVAVSPDGLSVYVAGSGGGSPSSGTVAVFRRNPADGTLTFASLFTGPYFDGRPHHLQGRAPELKINGGAEYTNDPHVMLSIENASRVDIGFEVSNDGGFKRSERRQADETNSYPWTLASTGPDRLAKTVYVRLTTFGPFGGQPITDEIILDETAPTILFARRESKSLKLKARDNLSGVRHVQVTRNMRKPGGWKRFNGKVAVPGGRGSVRVRVRDGAKNPSRWKVVR